METAYVSATLLLLSVVSPATASASRAETAATACIVTEKWDTLAGQPYSTQHADCRYDAASFQKRLLSIFRWPASDLSVETLERTFSLPPLRTSYDAPRDANYRAYASGPNNEDRWSASFGYEESFTPRDAWRRPRFRGTKRPILINPRIHGERRVEIKIFQGTKNSALASGCLQAGFFRDAARRAGWQEPKGIIIDPLPMHGGPAPSTVVFEHGRWSISVVFDREGECAEEMHYGTGADPGAN
jgi:hypothetical protein